MQSREKFAVLKKIKVVQFYKTLKDLATESDT